MSGRLALAVVSVAGAACLSSCFVMPKPEPFQQAVVARPLDPVALSAEPVAPLPETPDAPVEPERTDVAGAGDGSMALDRVIIRASTISQRAPNFSSEQAAALICGSIKGGYNVDAARRMHAATVKAEQARLDFDREKITGKQLDAIEKARQDAVIHYLLPVPVLNWMVVPVEKKADLPAPKSGNLSLIDTDAFTFNENGRSVTAVSGTIRNAGADVADVPPLTLRAIDEWDYTIAGQTSLLPIERLKGGEEQRFEVRFLNPPANTAEVYVHFAPPFLYRTRRDCEFFDPAKFDASAALSAPAVEPAMRFTGDYAAGELNQMTLFFRRESEMAWRCQALRKCDAAQAAERIGWRDLFRLAEAADEAWVALSAAEAARARGTAETTSAKLAQQAALQRLRALGAQALARAGTSVPDVVVSVSQASYGRDDAGLFVDVAGTIANTGSVERRVDALMVAFVDRLELPLSTVAIGDGGVLAPGETRTFQRRLDAGAARGTAGVRMAWGETREAAPARIPPRDIPWEVRVGAVARPE